MAATETTHPEGVTASDNRLMGFVDSDAAAGAMIVTLKAAEVPTANVRLFRGPEGLHDLEALLKGSWGEAEQAFFEQAVPELEQGHTAVSIDVENFDQAQLLAEAVARQGGHSFTHFGVMVDTGISTSAPAASLPLKG